ncbi:3-(3-hydroxy-phenyl)propionate hydroxylase [Hoeflea halophila]|uniref:3-(3-hydroxy-phenyl)propionate hydroxylase n=1 Tax=Hoeflea halophila TaxID=714899 RepID=A0A286IFS9_9HYPH|nr:FAD-dependent oxidoreductase [Hoeflea halophila]SOE18887.1 3-(3-hydroxy-phenyl)propionate hydroxylase [Hoeflea halophila]
MSKIFEVPLYPYQRSPDQDARAPVRHKVVVVGAGPVGLALAVDLAMQDVPVVVVDENDKVSWGSRAICFAKRPLEILDRLGCGDPMVDKGVVWNLGKVFFDKRQVFDFNLLTEQGHKRPAFINLQQYYLEQYLVDRVRELQAEGKPIELRGGSKVLDVSQDESGAELTIDTPDGPYRISAEWVVACDGAASPIRTLLGLEFTGRVFEDNFLIADVVMEADFPTERWFWFDPPFNRGQSALLHKQPDNVWRIDFQLGWDIDREKELKPENIDRRLKAMLGDEISYQLEWSSIYTFQCRRMERFREGRVLFAGDSAHQVSPFGARGANSGLQDADNLAWKLRLIMDGKSPLTLLDSYDAERVHGADENILNSSRSTDFITPKSEISRIFRDAVLDLSERYEATRPMVNSGRLSVPCTYDGSPLNGPDCAAMPERTRPGSPMVDAPVPGGWLLDRLGSAFHLLTIDAEAPDTVSVDGVACQRLALSTSDDHDGYLRQRYLGNAAAGVYLVRPDQHVAARWDHYDAAAVKAALGKAMGR